MDGDFHSTEFKKLYPAPIENRTEYVYHGGQKKAFSSKGKCRIDFVLTKYV